MQERKPPTEEEFKKTAEELREFFDDRDHTMCQPTPKGCIYGPGSCKEHCNSEPEIPSGGMLSRAEKIVDERMAKYGVPTESWTRIGRMWGAYLGIDDIPAEVCLQMMTMVKKIRERYEHHPDNWEDDAGYVDCAHRVMMEKLKKEGGGTPPKREPKLSTDMLTTEEVPGSEKPEYPVSGFKYPDDL